MKGLAYFGGTLALIGVLYFPLKVMADRRVRGSALAQAKEIAEKGDVDLALRHLDRYLASLARRHPRRSPGPGDEGELVLLGESARTADQALVAANAYDLLLRNDPSGPGRRETRRKLAEPLHPTIATGSGTTR